VGRARDRSDEVQSITSAPVARSEDIAHRQKVYLVQMGVRVLAFLGTVLSWGHVPLWLSCVLLVGAVVLPYTAVVLANQPRLERGVATPHLPPQLPGGKP
jgi:Protein of unknown function (DUF3099).